MSDDIVTRLRTECEAWDCKNIDEPCLTSEAADEIEHLRTEIVQLERNFEVFRTMYRRHIGTEPPL